jgi:hypothetical protein
MTNNISGKNTALHNNAETLIWQMIFAAEWKKRGERLRALVNLTTAFDTDRIRTSMITADRSTRKKL